MNKIFVVSLCLVAGCNSPLKNKDAELQNVFKISMGGMSVDLPKPKHPVAWELYETINPNNVSIYKHTMASFPYDDKADKGYIVSYYSVSLSFSNFSDSNLVIQEALEKERNEACEYLEISRSRKINLSGIPGIEFECIGNNRFAKFRIYLKINKFFMFMSSSPINNIMDDRDFFSSISAE